MLKVYSAHRRFGGNSVGGVFDVDGHVKILENAGEEGHGAHPLHLHVQKRVNGAVHLAQQRHQHGDIAHAQRGVVLHNEDTAHEIEEHGAHVGEGVDDDHKPTAGHALADVQADHAAVGRLVAAVLIVLTAKELHQQLAADRQLLVEDAVDLVIALLALLGQRPAGLTGPAGGDGKEGDHQRAHGSQDPVLPEHDDNRHCQRNGIGQNGGEGAGNNPLHTGDIAGHAGDNIALVIGGK